MRQQDKVILWPSYFDATKTRRNGRQVAKNSAVPNPGIQEIKQAAEELHMICELLANTSYPKAPWTRTGMLLVKKNREPKSQIVKKIASQLMRIRSSATPTK